MSVCAEVERCLGRRACKFERGEIDYMSESSSAAATSAASAEIGLLKQAYRVIKADFEKSQSQLAARGCTRFIFRLRAGGGQSSSNCSEALRKCAARSRDASCTRRTFRKCAIRVATCSCAVVERRRRVASDDRTAFTRPAIPAA